MCTFSIGASEETPPSLGSFTLAYEMNVILISALVLLE